MSSKKVKETDSLCYLSETSVVNRTASDWTEGDWKIFSDWLKELLQGGEGTVTFTKKDGTERIMKCTLKPELLPKQKVDENKIPRKKSENTLAVYDTEVNGWRSFTLKSVKQVAFDF